MFFARSFYSLIICLWAFAGLIYAAPPAITAERKIYAPDPPATHHVLIGIKYFDEGTQKPKTGEITLDLFGTRCPLTVQNFVTLARGFSMIIDPNGQEPTSISYKKTKFTTIKKNDIISGGDILPGASFSIFGFKFDDENFDVKHDRIGRISMANDGEPNTNDSRFFITMNATGSPEYDGKNVAFGQITFGFEHLRKIQNVKVSETFTPVKDVSISYIIIDELKVSDYDSIHQEYLQRLAKFVSGDLSAGVTMATTEEAIKETEKLEEMKLAQLNHPASKVGLGICLLLIIYFIVRNKRNFFSGYSSASTTGNVVSVRND